MVQVRRKVRFVALQGVPMANPGIEATSIPADVAYGGLDMGVFDLDGVVTRTARLHAASWKLLFDAYLRERAERSGAPFRPFEEADYRRYVDGKPRYEGVRSFLASRGIELPHGAPEDPPDRESVCGLGNRKNLLFNERLGRDGVEVLPGAVNFIRRLRAAGLKTALVSSSKNAAAVLARAELTELFDVRVDGLEAARLGLKGKPDPDTFLHAAARLGVAPARAFAVEDALAGVAAARAAGFRLVVGIGGRAQAAELIEHGADVVVADLAELDLAAARPDALVRFADIRRRLAARRPAVFLDYDGSLTPIVARPELAVLDEATQKAVRELSRRCPVAIVSGRDRADVERLVGIDTLIYAGSHGFDIAGPGGLCKQHERAAEFLPALDRAETRLREALAGIEGALVERKRYALAAHYRLVAEAEVAAVDAAVAAALAEAAGKLRRTGGKKVFELRPALPWDKGKAVLWLLEALGLDGPEVLPFYLGDDETDEDAFAAVDERDGIGVLVAAAPVPTVAVYRLPEPAAAGRFLRALTGALQP